MNPSRILSISKCIWNQFKAGTLQANVLREERVNIDEKKTKTHLQTVWVIICSISLLHHYVFNGSCLEEQFRLQDKVSHPKGQLERIHWSASQEACHWYTTLAMEKIRLPYSLALERVSGSQRRLCSTCNGDQTLCTGRPQNEPSKGLCGCCKSL